MSKKSNLSCGNELKSWRKEKEISGTENKKEGSFLEKGIHCVVAALKNYYTMQLAFGWARVSENYGGIIKIYAG